MQAALALNLWVVSAFLANQAGVIQTCSAISSPASTTTTTTMSTATITPASCSFQSQLNSFTAFPVSPAAMCTEGNCLPPNPACDCTLGSGLPQLITCGTTFEICVSVDGATTPISQPVGGSPLLCTDGVLTITDATSTQYTVDSESAIACLDLKEMCPQLP